MYKEESSMAQMVRKQVYVSADQDAFLKERSNELGITEAEVVRQALDLARDRAASASSEAAWRELLAYIQAHRMGDTSAPGWTFSRDEIYDEMYEERFAARLRRQEESQVHGKASSTR